MCVAALMVAHMLSVLAAARKFTYTPPLSVYRAGSRINPKDLQYYGDGLRFGVTGKSNVFHVEMSTAALGATVYGLYATLEGSDTVIGIYSARTHVNQTMHVFEYSPVFPGLYILSVDVLRYGPHSFLPVTPLHGLTVNVTGDQLYDAQAHSRPCGKQAVTAGMWIKCSSPSAPNSCLRWGGMVFVPDTCHYEIYTNEELQALSSMPVGHFAAEAPVFKDRNVSTFSAHSSLAVRENSIVIVGNSVTRYVFQGMIDMILSNSNLRKCWGHIYTTVNNVAISYQDMRGLFYTSYPSFHDRKQHEIECHNDHIAVDSYALEANTSQYMENIFASNPATVVFQFTHMTPQILKNLLSIPAWWNGNLIGIITRDPLSSTMQAPPTFTHQEEREWSVVLGHKLHIIDTMMMTLPMLRHQEGGVYEYSMHWGLLKQEEPGDIHMFGLVNDMLGQMIFNIHFGPKAAVNRKLFGLWNWWKSFNAQGGEEMATTSTQKANVTTCYDCPPDLVPFHTNVDPALTCDGGRTNGNGKHVYRVSCPKECLAQNVVLHLPIQHSTIAIRRCVLEDL